MKLRIRDVFTTALAIVSLLTLSLELGIYVSYKYYGDDARDLRTREIYMKLWAQTGQTQNALPLVIVDSPVANAYNDGTRIVLFTGIFKTTDSWDEIALILAHEIAHGTLYHLHMLNDWNLKIDDGTMTVLEANADKMGAVYMMKAGFDICKGREWFSKLLKSSGDYQQLNHPGYAYRYSELNINCD